MRVRVIGNSQSAAAVRASLHLAGVVVSDSGYGYTVEVNDETEFSIPTVDGVDSDLERKMVNCICVAAETSIVLLRPGGIQSDRHIRIGIPVDDAAHLVEKGIMRAVVQMLVPAPRPERHDLTPIPTPIAPPILPASNFAHTATERSIWQRLKEVFTG